MTHQAIGDAITSERIISFIKSFESNTTTLPTLAPNTFRIPISFSLLEEIAIDELVKLKHAMSKINPPIITEPITAD